MILNRHLKSRDTTNPWWGKLLNAKPLTLIMKIRFYFQLTIAIAVLFTTGCVRMLRNGGNGDGTNYRLPIAGNPVGADVEVPELNFFGIAPTNVVIPRSRHLDGVTILISKDGYEPQRYDLKMRFDAVGGIGLFLDALTFPVWLVTAGAYAADIAGTSYKGSSITDIFYTLTPVHQRQPSVKTGKGRILSPGEEEYLRGYKPKQEEPEEPTEPEPPPPKKNTPKRPATQGGTLRVIPI